MNNYIGKDTRVKKEHLKFSDICMKT